MSNAHESIAIGPKASFTFPVPVGFVPNRATIASGASIVSALVRIDFAKSLGVALTVIMKDGAGNANYDLSYKEMIYSDGFNNANAQYLNPILGPAVVVATGATAKQAVYNIGGTSFPATQAIEVTLKNNGALATATAPDPFTPGDLGKGAHVRVSVRS